MRNKQPVTQREYLFQGTETLQSTPGASRHISDASAAPARRNRRITGYLSMRTQPPRAEAGDR